MTQLSIVKPLGEVLLQTGLVSSEQIEAALQEQSQNSTLRLGEILARHGWLKQETANFFAERWPRYLSQRRKQPIGQYLRDASLLDLSQVKSILQEQMQTETRFGELIVKKGWLSQDTIDFFLNSIHDEIDLQDPQEMKAAATEDLQLEALRDQLIRNQHCNPYQLLLTYQKALSHPMIRVSENPEQTELLKLGLLIEQDHQCVANPNYETALNTSWVDQELGKLRPFEQVRINLFKLDEKASLPFVVLEEVFFWTGREPSLTQSLCHAIYEFGDFIGANEEKEKVANLVQTHIIDDWSHNIAAKHFQDIIEGLRDANHHSVELLSRYRQVLRQEDIAISNDAVEQTLRDLGLIVDHKKQLRISNRIYGAVFNDQWVTEEMAQPAPQTHPSTELIVAPTRDLALAPTPFPKEVMVPDESAKPPKRGFRFGRLLIGLLALGAIGILLAIVAQRVIRNQAVTRSFDQANDLLSQGKHKEAIANYNDVLNIDGNYHQAWTNRGYALAGTGDYAQMLSSCRSATIIDPQAVYAWNCQGEALHNLNQFDAAIAAFDQAIQLQPSDPVFWINKSESLLASQQYEPALSASQTAIETLEADASQIDPSRANNELSIAWNMKGRVFQNTEQNEAALDAYEQSLDSNPNYFPAQLGKGIILKRLEAYPEAKAEFEHALTLDLTDSQRAEAWFYLGLTLCNLKQPDEALIAYDQALQLKPDFDAAETARRNYCS